MSEVDTLNIYEELRGDLGDAAAKKLARVIKESVESAAATKGDLALLRSDIGGDMKALEGRLRKDFQDSEASLRKEIAATNLRVAGMMLAQVGLFAALLKLLN